MSAKQFTTCPHCGQQFPLKKAFQHTATFEQSAALVDDNPPPRLSFWQSDGAVYSLAAATTGAFTLLAGGWYELEYAGLAAASLAVGVGIGLHVLKILLHAPARPSLPKPDTVTIKIQQTGTDENPHGIKLDQIQDGKISLEDLRRVAGAIRAGHNFSRQALGVHARISQSKYSRIKSEFERLDFCHTDRANKTTLTRAGRLFLWQILD